MVKRDLARGTVLRILAGQHRSSRDDAVVLHVRVLGLVKLARLLQDRIFDGHLAHVVQHCGGTQPVLPQRSVLHGVTLQPSVEDLQTDVAHALHMRPRLLGVAHLGHAYRAFKQAKFALRQVLRQTVHVPQQSPHFRRATDLDTGAKFASAQSRRERST
jgi:hypothetical protein